LVLEKSQACKASTEHNFAFFHDSEKT